MGNGGIMTSSYNTGTKITGEKIRGRGGI